MDKAFLEAFALRRGTTFSSELENEAVEKVVAPQPEPVKATPEQDESLAILDGFKSRKSLYENRVPQAVGKELMRDSFSPSTTMSERPDFEVVTFDDPGPTTPASEKTLDLTTKFALGMVQGSRFLVDAFGADSEVSQSFRGVEEELTKILSAGAREDQQEIAQLLERAKTEGTYDQLMTGIEMLAVDPAGTVFQAIGNSVPVIAGTVLATVAGGPIAGTATALTLGATQGSGIAKSTIYDTVKRELMKLGRSEADAEQAAVKAQEWGGKNTDMILAGAGVTAFGSIVGLDKIGSQALLRKISSDLASKKSAQLGTSIVAETATEGLQGATDQLTANVATQREGIETPTMGGVIAQGVMEAGAGGMSVGATAPLTSMAMPSGKQITIGQVDAETIAAESEGMMAQRGVQPDTNKSFKSRLAQVIQSPKFLNRLPESGPVQRYLDELFRLVDNGVLDFDEVISSRPYTNSLMNLAHGEEQYRNTTKAEFLDELAYHDASRVVTTVYEGRDVERDGLQIDELDNRTESQNEEAFSPVALARFESNNLAEVIGDEIFRFDDRATFPAMQDWQTNRIDSEEQLDAGFDFVTNASADLGRQIDSLRQRMDENPEFYVFPEVMVVLNDRLKYIVDYRSALVRWARNEATNPRPRFGVADIAQETDDSRANLMQWEAMRSELVDATQSLTERVQSLDSDMLALRARFTGESEGEVQTDDVSFALYTEAKQAGSMPVDYRGVKIDVKESPTEDIQGGLPEYSPHAEFGSQALVFSRVASVIDEDGNRLLHIEEMQSDHLNNAVGEKVDYQAFRDDLRNLDTAVPLMQERIEFQTAQEEDGYAEAMSDEIISDDLYATPEKLKDLADGKKPEYGRTFDEVADQLNLTDEQRSLVKDGLIEQEFEPMGSLDYKLPKDKLMKRISENAITTWWRPMMRKLRNGEITSVNDFYNYTLSAYRKPGQRRDYVDFRIDGDRLILSYTEEIDEDVTRPIIYDESGEAIRNPEPQRKEMRKKTNELVFDINTGDFTHSYTIYASELDSNTMGTVPLNIVETHNNVEQASEYGENVKAQVQRIAKSLSEVESLIQQASDAPAGPFGDYSGIMRPQESLLMIALMQMEKVFSQYESLKKKTSNVATKTHQYEADGQLFNSIAIPESSTISVNGQLVKDPGYIGREQNPILLEGNFSLPIGSPENGKLLLSDLNNFKNQMGGLKYGMYGVLQDYKIDQAEHFHTRGKDQYLPFKDKLYDLMIKRLLYMAANEGYDGISVSDPKAHIDRWGRQFEKLYMDIYGKRIPNSIKKMTKIPVRRKKVFVPNVAGRALQKEIGERSVFYISPKQADDIVADGFMFVRAGEEVKQPLTREDGLAVIEDMAKRLNIAEDVNIAIALDQLPGNAKGGVFPNNQIVIRPEAHESVDDLKRTVLHELVGHYGVRRILTKPQLDELITKINLEATRDGEFATEVEKIKKRGYDPEDQAVFAEEIMAMLAETEPTVFERVKNSIAAFLTKVMRTLGINTTNISKAEVLQILGRSKQSLRNRATDESVMSQDNEVRPATLYSRRREDDRPGYFDMSQENVDTNIRDAEATAYYGADQTKGYFVRMPIQDFLLLTTNDDYGTDKILEEGPSASSIGDDVQNRFDPAEVDRPNLDATPFLILRNDEDADGNPIVKVAGHEGRHRAALASQEGAETMPVFIRYEDKLVFDFEENKRRRGQQDFADLTASREVVGQFDETRRATIPQGVEATYAARERAYDVMTSRSEREEMPVFFRLPDADESMPDMAINVRVDSAAGIDYAELIINGDKTYETRDSDSLRPYVGRRVGIAKTGAGKAQAIGSVEIGEPLVVSEEEFRSLQDQHMVPEGSAFDIKEGGQKFLYPVSNPERFDQPMDVGAGIVSRKIVADASAPSRYDVDTLINEEVPEGVSNKADFVSFIDGLHESPRDLEADRDAIAEDLARETEVALNKSGNAAEWYRKTIERAMAVAAKVFPEIGTDTDAKAAFQFALAITSNGAGVDENTGNAVSQYQAFRRTGKFPEKGWGKETEAMVNSFRVFNRLIDTYGLTELNRLMNMEWTAGDLKELGFSVSGELADATMYFSAIFGPKIGQGFYQNLGGNFTPLTMDRWFMRTIGRVTGRLSMYDNQKHVGYVEAARKATEESGSGIELAISRYNKNATEKVTIDDFMNDFDVATDVLMAGYRAWSQSSFDKSMDLPVMRTGRSLSKLFDTRDAPSTGTERAQIRALMSDVQQKLADKGINLDMASIQALLWFPEKDLYLHFGVTSKKAAPTDYEQEMTKVARKKGVSKKEIDDGLRNSTQPANGQSDGSTDGQDRGESRSDAELRDAVRTNQYVRRLGQELGGGDGAFRRGSRKTNTLNLPSGRQKVDGTSYKVGTGWKRTLLSKLQSAAGSPTQYIELAPSKENAQLFTDLITRAAQSHGDRGKQVYIYDVEEIADAKLFITPDGLGGFAVKKDGDIVSLFATAQGPFKNVSFTALALAVQSGGVKLDAFDPVLPKLYRRMGFSTAARVAFDPNEKPDGWNTETMGEPDVHFMVFDPAGVVEESVETVAYNKALTVQNLAKTKAKKARSKISD